MRDRTPTRALENGALRYGVYAEDGSLLRYEYLALEDEPADPGTELRKATLLQDSTEVSLFGSAADRTVDDVFAGIAGQLKLIKSDMAAITLTVQDTNGKPIPEVLVQGILSESGQAVYTNASGVTTGFVGEGKQVIKISGYADVEDYTETITVVKGTTIAKTISVNIRNFLELLTSGTVKFSGNVERVDYSEVGGGGAGGWGMASYYSGAGGGSGYVKIVTNANFEPNISYPAIVGAGGKPASNSSGTGSAGGKTSFMGVDVAGGSPGTRDTTQGNNPTYGGAGERTGANGVLSVNYTGVNGRNGTAGISGFFASFTTTKSVAGSGASGGAGSDYTGSPYSASGGVGSDGGGNGGGTNHNIGATPGINGTGGGGGGGACVSGGRDDPKESYPGMAGGSGCIAIRMHLKSAA